MAITVTQSGGDGGLASLVYDPANHGITNLTQTQAAQDANFTINGFAATSASNQVSSAITGVTINLLKATAARRRRDHDLDDVTSAPTRAARRPRSARS